MARDIYEEITNKIIAALETGVKPWVKPWNAEHAAGRITRPLRHNFEPYSGINVLNLWMEATERNFTAPIWMTFKQSQELGGHVKKGETGSLVVYANTFKKTEHNEETGEDTEQAIPFLKGYTVFNVEQIEGLPEKYYAPAQAPEITPDERNAAAEQFFKNTGALIKEGGNRAYYSISTDHIQMPPFISFQDAESYYATLSHECTHWTRHESRLDRDLGRKSWGDAGYAMEELVAELGSAYLAADLGLAVDIREENAAYIGNWLEVLKGDKKAIFSAASHAQKAAEHLHSYQANPAPCPAPVVTVAAEASPEAEQFEAAAQPAAKKTRRSRKKPDDGFPNYEQTDIFNLEF